MGLSLKSLGPVLLLIGLWGCTSPDDIIDYSQDLEILDPAPGSTPGFNKDRNVYFGDLHVHTKHSFDAYIFGTLATPDDAYEFAKGKPIKHPAGFDVSRDRPLDFYGVTDHGTFLGQVAEAATPGNPYYDSPSSAQVNDLNSPENLNTSRSIPLRITLES